MVGDVKVVADKEFSFLLDNAKIISNKGHFGKSFSLLLGKPSSGGCS